MYVTRCMVPTAARKKNMPLTSWTSDRQRPLARSVRPPALRGCVLWSAADSVVGGWGSAEDVLQVIAVILA